MMRFKNIGTFGIGTLLFFGSLHLQAATQYKIEDLGKIPEGASKTVSINNNGDYTISLQNELAGVSTYIISNGVKQEIGSNGNITVTSLNDFNQATGLELVNDLTNKRSAFLYSDGNLQNIETMNTFVSFGLDINASGIIVGGVRLEERAANRAFLYNPANGQMELLKDVIASALPPQDPTICDLECWRFENASGINNQGMVTGVAYAPHTADNFPSSISGRLRAFLFDGQELISLGTLGGDVSFGQAINNHGHVAGVSDLEHETHVISFPSDPVTEPTQPDPLRVFLYDGSSMKDMGILNGGVHSRVFAINDHDEVVGTVTFDGYQHAFKSTQRGLVDLNSLISSGSAWTELTVATDINNNGVIVGYGQMNGETHGFKLIPVEKSEIACLHVSAEICTKILSKTQ